MKPLLLNDREHKTSEFYVISPSLASFAIKHPLVRSSAVRIQVNRALYNSRAMGVAEALWAGRHVHMQNKCLVQKEHMMSGV